MYHCLYLKLAKIKKTKTNESYSEWSINITSVGKWFINRLAKLWTHSKLIWKYISVDVLSKKNKLHWVYRVWCLVCKKERPTETVLRTESRSRSTLTQSARSSGQRSAGLGRLDTLCFGKNWQNRAFRRLGLFKRKLPEPQASCIFLQRKALNY